MRDLADVFDMFKIWPASESHPAALFCCMTTTGVKNLLRAEVTDSWYGVNQMYEVTLAQPSEYLSGTLPPMIVDVKKCSVTVFTRANLALIARQFAVAEFHPEPFAHFIVTNCPYLLAALWSIGKLFLTESARNKFVICTGDASTEIQKRYGVAKRDQPIECGGEARDEMIAARDWLAVVPHDGRDQRPPARHGGTTRRGGDGVRSGRQSSRAQVFRAQYDTEDGVQDGHSTVIHVPRLRRDSRRRIRLPSGALRARL